MGTSLGVSISSAVEKYRKDKSRIFSSHKWSIELFPYFLGNFIWDNTGFIGVFFVWANHEIFQIQEMFPR